MCPTYQTPNYMWITLFVIERMSYWRCPKIRCGTRLRSSTSTVVGHITPCVACGRLPLSLLLPFAAFAAERAPRSREAPRRRRRRYPHTMLHLLKKASAAAKPKTNTMQARLMSGGHGHGGPPPTGFEAKVRAVLPQDYQVRADIDALGVIVVETCRRAQECN